MGNLWNRLGSYFDKLHDGLTDLKEARIKLFENQQCYQYTIEGEKVRNQSNIKPKRKRGKRRKPSIFSRQLKLDKFYLQ
jgi:hypothetical protein